MPCKRKSKPEKKEGERKEKQQK